MGACAGLTGASGRTSVAALPHAPRRFAMRFPGSSAAFVIVLAALSADAATLTCQDRSVRALAEWAPYTDGDSAQAADFGLFDRDATGYLTGSYPFYTAVSGWGHQRSEMAGNAIQARCSAQTQFVTMTGQSGSASAASQLEVCFHLQSSTVVTIQAQATATIWSGAPASASFALSGPGGLHIELRRDCGPGGCNPDSVLAVAQPVPPGDYTVQASTTAGATGATNGNWLSRMTLDLSVELGEPLVSVARLTWTDAKQLYR